MAIPSAHNAIICDPDLDSRMRLKQATASVVEFGEVLQAGSVRDATTRLAEVPTDVVFVSHRYGTQAADFIAKARTFASTRDATFIMLLPNTNGQSAIAQHMLHGIDGFLFEPYSVDSLVEITRLAARLKRERALARERVALSLMIQELINQFDVVTSLKAEQMDYGRSWSRLASTAAALRNLSPETLAVYYELAIKQFGEVPLPKTPPPKRAYSGASTRVKKKLEEKRQSELEQQK